ncbi:acyl-CoA thioesterase [Alkalibacillus haloalkaliphilus]|uniref:acyl-CoA thioesterase n=1 Tax=Alkalibacillus haloalkaliphilus TaxID=94136 RepID=UPI002935CFAC|nr:thioesterase family protein [Alkalibacillus haloalkaliphilus]MDV2581155.1 thioesterase family protein [Alkalibacillus haloalkaliphilus]
MKTPNYIEDMNEWIDEFCFYIPINIRFSETDMFGHVNNVSPFIYFEEARIAYMNEINLFEDLKPGVSKVPVVSDLQCDYLKQIYFGEQIKMYVKTNHIGNSSIDIHYMGKNSQDEICLVGRGRIVQIDSSTGKAEPFTEEQIERLKSKKAINQ